MNIRSDEPELRGLMLAGFDGDAAAHKALLTRLSGNLRAYFKTHLARIGKGPADAEDLVQETLIALHTRRHTYDPKSGSCLQARRQFTSRFATVAGGVNPAAGVRAGSVAGRADIFAVPR